MLPVNVAAPETLNDGIYSTASDVYMFGFFIWEVLARQTPHSDRREFSKAYKDFKGFIHLVVHEDLRPPLPPEWPSGLRILLSQCWHRNPGSRPTMVQVNDMLRLCRKEVLDNAIPLPISPRVHMFPAIDPHVYYSPVERAERISPNKPEEAIPPNEDGSGRRGNQFYGQAPAVEPSPATPAQDLRNHPYYRSPNQQPEPVRNLYDFGPPASGPEG